MLDFGSWGEAVKASLVSGLNAAAQEVERAAKEKAPVRRIFRGRRRSIRFKTAAEVEADRPFIAQLGLAPQFLALPSMRRPRRASSFGRVYSTQSSDINRAYPGMRAAAMRGGQPTSPGRLRSAAASNLLTGRGRYEVSSGRAFFRTGPNSGTVGGRLRGEIYTEPASTGGVAVARVISPTPYAKYQEFGTRRHPAQPFLRPALAESQNAISARMREALAEGVKSPLPSSGHIVVTVKA